MSESVKVGRKRCGCAVAAVVVPTADSHADEFADFAREIKRWGRAGMTVETHPVEWVRTGGLSRCKCAKASV